LVPSSGNQIVSDVKPAVALKPAFSPSSQLYLAPISSTLAPAPHVVSSTTPAPPVTQIYQPPSYSSTPRPQNEANLPPLVIYNKPSPTSTPSPLALIDNNYYTASPAAVHITPYNPSYYPTSTPASIKTVDESQLPPLVLYNGPSSTYQSPVSSTTPRPVFVTSTHQPGLFAIVSPNSEPKYHQVSALSNELLPPRYVSQNVIASTTARPVAVNAYQVKPFYSRYSLKPVESKSQYYSSKNSQLYKLGDGYTPQYANYDGVSATNNGFRYFLPRQYHEEQNTGNGRRDGSFGYIDPFGIRRVVYYNAGPDGFVHRKNNRYVGFNATPYDPRPVWLETKVSWKAQKAITVLFFKATYACWSGHIVFKI
jgi:hypothetical protein